MHEADEPLGYSQIGEQLGITREGARERVKAARRNLGLPRVDAATPYSDPRRMRGIPILRPR